MTWISKIQILENKPPTVTVRRWRHIRRETMRAMGMLWHNEMLPEHFAPNARFVYSYKPRTRQWEDTKKQAAARGSKGRRLVDPKAATDALTFSGTLRDNVTQIASVKVFEQRFKLVMPGTPYTPARPRSASQPPLAEETTRLLEREKQQMARLGKKTAVAMLKESKPPRTRTT
jgi:hypothetical protein